MHHGAEFEALERFAVEPGASLAEQDWSARCGFDRDRGAETDDKRSASHPPRGSPGRRVAALGSQLGSQLAEPVDGGLEAFEKWCWFGAGKEFVEQARVGVAVADVAGAG